MRKVKVINIEGRGEATVKEVSPWSVYQAWSSEDRSGELEKLLDDSLQPSFEQVKTWYASEIEQVVDAWLEVNAAFFGIAAKLKVDGVIKEMMAAVTNNLPSVFVDSLKQAMPELGTTDGQPS